MRKNPLITKYTNLKPLYSEAVQVLVEGFIVDLESLEENFVRTPSDILIRKSSVYFDGFEHGYPNVEDMKKFVLECIDKVTNK